MQWSPLPPPFFFGIKGVETLIGTRRFLAFLRVLDSSYRELHSRSTSQRISLFSEWMEKGRSEITNLRGSYDVEFSSLIWFTITSESYLTSWGVLWEFQCHLWFCLFDTSFLIFRLVTSAERTPSYRWVVGFPIVRLVILLIKYGLWICGNYQTTCSWWGASHRNQHTLSLCFRISIMLLLNENLRLLRSSESVEILIGYVVRTTSVKLGNVGPCLFYLDLK